MIKNINIFGSNFGSLVHLKAVKKISKFLNILIWSPNIHKKKINLCKSKKFNNYQETLKSNPDAVGIATQPKIQSKICKYIIKNKINSIKYILLEKPIAQNFKEVKSIIKGLKKRKINFLVNFIFENNLIFKKTYFFLKRKNITYVEYKWKFQQMYFKNKIATWKTNYIEGGGVVNYYLIHIYYNLYLLFNKLEIIKINYSSNSKIVTKINLLLKADKKTKILIEIDINSLNNQHSIFFLTSNKTYNLISTAKNWVKGFKLFINNKKIKFKGKELNRENLTQQNYSKLFSSKYNKKKTINNIFKSHYLCNETINKIYK